MKLFITTGIYPPDIGGPATYSKLIFDELPKSGIPVEVLSFGEVRKLPKVVRHFVYFCKILLRARKSDIILAQDTVSVGLPSLLASKILGKRFFVRVPGDYAWEQSVQRYGVKDSIDDFQNKKHGWKVEVLKSIQRKVVNGAEKVITPSMYFKKLVSGWIKDSSKVNCIYNGIDVSEIPQVVGKYESKTIISAGRLVPWKGFEALILSLKLLSDWKLYIAGDGPIRSELESVVKENNLEDRVFFLGQIKREELVVRMQKSDVFVLNTHFESFSFQVVEAMACGIPVITTNIGNLAEIIDNQKNGILIKPDDVDAIVKNCLEVSNNLEKRRNIVEEARKKAQQFSIENTIEKLKQLMI